MIVSAGMTITITSATAVFTAADVGKQIWQKYNSLGNNVAGRAQITAYTSPTQVTAVTLTPFDMSNTAAWYRTTGKVYGLLNFVGETIGTQVDGAPGGNFLVSSDGSIALDEQAGVVQTGYPYLGMLASMNIDVGGDTGPGDSQRRKIRQIMPRFVNTVGARVGTTKWNTKPLPFKAQDQDTDRPTALYNDVIETIVSDSWSRQTKQVIIMQDIPSPQTILTVDCYLEYGDG